MHNHSFQSFQLLNMLDHIYILNSSRANAFNVNIGTCELWLIYITISKHISHATRESVQCDFFSVACPQQTVRKSLAHFIHVASVMFNQFKLSFK